MKLFALGVSDPNPINWKPWHEVELWLAEDKQQALELAGYAEKGKPSTYPIAEIDMMKAGHLMSMDAMPDD